jgi:hypothetical protein
MYSDRLGKTAALDSTIRIPLNRPGLALRAIA